MPHNPGAALELAYVIDKLNPATLDVVGDSNRVKGRYYLRRDREGRIYAHRINVVESKRVQTTTTNRVATRSMFSRVLMAAEGRNQPPAYAYLLRSVYDPDCPAWIADKVYAWAVEYMKTLIPKNARENRQARALRLVYPLLEQYGSFARSGQEKYTEADLCKAIGFSNVRDASFDRDYRRMVAAFLLGFQEAEQEAIRPVVDVVSEIFEAPEVEPWEGRAPTFKSVLTLKTKSA